MVFNNLVGMARRWGGGRGRTFGCVTGWRVRGGGKKPKMSHHLKRVWSYVGVSSAVKVWTWVGGGGV